MGLNACPIIGASGLTDDLECLDITHELESCGGCASIGQGQDCTSIKGAWNVGCEQGSCAGKWLFFCAIFVSDVFFFSLYAAGFRRSQDGKTCTEI